jgi:hypothetical protein
MITDSEQDAFIYKAMANVMQPKAALPLKTCFQAASITIDHGTLSHCLVALAHLINDGDDVYLPIFERIKNELAQLEHTTELKDLAMNLVAQGAQNAFMDTESLH